MKRLGKGWVLVAVGMALGASVTAGAGASEVRFFKLQSRQAFLAGTLEGIAVDPLGRLELADRAERLAELGEPFLFSAAAHPRGWVVGTGNAGRVLLVNRSGEVETLFEAPEPEIFALHVDPDGVVWAGSSPGGKVYRIDDEGGTAFFDPAETYIWSLARAADGELLVATGTDGKLFAVDAEGTGRVIYDAEDTHLRALAVLADGDLLLGTAGEGLVLRMTPDGRVRTLYDAPQPEVVAFAVDPEGIAYAAVLASESSLVDLGKAAASSEAKNGDEETAAEGGTVTVTVSAEGAASAATGSRPPRYTGPRSALIRLEPQGRVETVWRFEDETVYDLAWRRGRLWVATGLEGKLYSLRDRKMVLEKDVDEQQVVALVEDDPGPALATANAAALYRILAETERRGVYTSPSLDAGEISRFGSANWRGDVPRGTEISFAFRSGMSSEPDLTWSEWTEAASGEELSLAEVPGGRYLQWRAVLEAADGRSPSLREVALSYRQVNLPPRIEALVVLDPGEIVVPANFNPANQVFEPAHPNRQGIFTTLEPARQREERRSKILWKRGYRTLRWQAEDPNGDELTAALSFRPEGDFEQDDETGWLELAGEIEEPFVSFDATALPDGLYRFRLEVADRRDGAADRLAADEITEPVLIDHTPPRIVERRRRGGVIELEVGDALSPLRGAEVSFDAGEWQPLVPVDGLLDGRSESVVIEPPADSRLVLVRLTDAALNLVTHDLSAGRDR